VPASAVRLKIRIRLVKFVFRGNVYITLSGVKFYLANNVRRVNKF